MSHPRLLPAYQLSSHDRQPSNAALVPRIREAVADWRRGGYPGATNTSRYLLAHWFESDHEAEGEPWLYYYCQREAVETTVYLYEVLRKQRLGDLVTEFGSQEMDIRFSPFDDQWCRYVYKMATGSGKTKVMSLLMAWSYFNAVRESSEVATNYSKTFLVLAPNVIVYERLLRDFGNNGRIFSDDPVVPPEWKSDWRVNVVTRDSPTDSVQSDGAIFVTNIQQLYAPRESKTHEPRQLRDVIGEPVGDVDVSAGRVIRAAIEQRDDLMILNDEGHHIHDPRLRWSETIRDFNDGFSTRRGRGIKAQLDFSATPKHNNGKLFDHIIVDYPIRQAIRDGVVKQPHLVTLENAQESEVNDAGDRYRDKLTAGIELYRSLCDRLVGIDAQPLMFVMTEDTKSADEVADWLVRHGEFAKKEILVIHTNRDGTISEAQSNAKELVRLRRAAHEVDSPMSQYKVIASVLMLREGWDVKNVCLIVPLRPYSAASQILPEQTLGRGLRRMFPLGAGDEREELLVVDHEAFADFWRREVDGESIGMRETPNEVFQQTAVTVVADAARAPELEILIPRLSPSLVRELPDLNELEVDELEKHRIAVALEGLAEEPIYYSVREMDSWDVVEQGEIEREFTLTRVGYLNFVCDLILRECRLRGLSNGFAMLAPKVQQYIEEVGFRGQAKLDDQRALLALNHAPTTNAILHVFVRGINSLSIRRHRVEDEHSPILVSRTRPFVTRRPTYPNPRRSLFNHVPVDSDLELEFAGWLDKRADDVVAFVKNESAVGFRLEYLSELGGIRHYYPDFVVRLRGGGMMVIETKGLETTEVPRKDERVTQWCRDVTELTGRVWRYSKVRQQLFNRGDGRSSVSELAAACRQELQH